jgi:hypothetical protein
MNAHVQSIVPPEAGTSGGGRRLGLLALLLLAAALTACARQVPDAVEPGAPGFFHGLFHGWIILFSFVGSLFSDSISIYSVPNNGGWYDFGFALGVGAFSSGAAAGARNR